MNLSDTQLRVINAFEIAKKSSEYVLTGEDFLTVFEAFLNHNIEISEDEKRVIMAFVSGCLFVQKKPS